EDQPPGLLGRLDHGVAGKDLHSSDESIEVDELRHLGLVVHEGISIKPRCFFYEALVKLFALGRGPQAVTDAVLAALGHPAGDNRRQRSGSRSRERRKRGNIEHIHLRISLMAARTEPP